MKSGKFFALPQSSFLFFILTLCLAFLVFPAQAASTWPADAGIDITSSLQALSPNLEPSGMVWQPRLEKFVIVGDEGDVCLMNQDGSSPSCVDIGSYDLESVTIADASTNYAYLGVEYISTSSSTYEIQILEFDLSAMTLTGKKWNLATNMVGTSSNGMEAMTFVPNGDHAYPDSTSGGLFYAGSQYDGKVYIFDVDLNNSGTKTYLGSFTPKSGYTDIADMYYSVDTATLYAVVDNKDVLLEMTADGVLIAEYSIPGDDQEGIALVTSCPDLTATFYTSEDSGYSAGPDVWEFTNFPVSCVTTSTDNDGDGVASDLDCNDSDATVSTLHTFYLDADVDGLGSSVSTSVCANSAPAGYVTNSTDINDSDYDNDNVNSSSDCNDRDAAAYRNNTFYLDHDGDGLGDAANSTTVCSETVPSGYVTNSSDTNDTGVTAATSKIEFSGNSVDDDGDGLVDEDNTVTENGYDTTYSSNDPGSKSAYKAAVLSVSGSTNGAIRVKYADNAVYSYTVFSGTTTSKSTTVSSYFSTGYLIVYKASSSKWALVNAYTGQIYYTR